MPVCLRQEGLAGRSVDHSANANGAGRNAKVVSEMLLEMSEKRGTKLLGILVMVCLLATAVVACPARGAVIYTGSVVTTDSAGTPKESFIQGDNVYANVSLNLYGNPYNGIVTVSLVRTTDEAIVGHFHATTDNPVVGWNNGSVSGASLSTSFFISGEAMAYDVVVDFNGQEVARSSIVVVAMGLWIEPDSMSYYPGQDTTIRLVTPHTSEMFYVQVVNLTMMTYANWTGLVAPDGRWQTTWTIPTDLPDGFYEVAARAEGSNAIWSLVEFEVQKIVLIVASDREGYLPGESALISYDAIDISTLGPSTGVIVNYSANWLNASGQPTWQNGTLAGSQGVQTFGVPVDIALYSDVFITYWANETTGPRSVQSVIVLYIELLQADIDLVDWQLIPGDAVTVNVRASAGSEGLPDAEVDISVEMNGTAIPEYGGSLMTNQDGTAMHEFTLASDSPLGTYIVNATVSKVGYSVTRMVSFNVDFTGALLVTLDKDLYYSGETVEAVLTVVWNGQQIQPASVLYLVLGMSGLLNTNTTTNGTVSFTLPTTEIGYFAVEAVTEVSGYQLSGWAEAQVLVAGVGLVAENDLYSALDRLVFDYEVVTLVPGADLEYSIVDDRGGIVASGTLPFSAEGSIAYDVPQDASMSYTCTLVVAFPSGSWVQASATALLLVEYDLVLRIASSPYLSGAFRPGDSVDVDYNITPRGVPDIALYELSIRTSWSDSTYTLLTSEKNGTLHLEIPATATNGMTQILGTLYNGVSGDFLSDSWTTLTISDTAANWETGIGDLQNETDLLRNELGTAQHDIIEMNERLEAMQNQLNTTLTALNESLEKLAETSENMSSIGDDLDTISGAVSDRPTMGTIATWLVLALAAFAAVVVGVILVFRRKGA